MIRQARRIKGSYDNGSEQRTLWYEEEVKVVLEKKTCYFALGKCRQGRKHWTSEAKLEVHEKVYNTLDSRGKNIYRMAKRK